MIKGPRMAGPRTYDCHIERIIDADTLEITCDVGFRMSYRDHFRLNEIDAPEMNTDAGRAAKEWLENYIDMVEGSDDKYFRVRIIKHGKFRWIADLVVFQNNMPLTTVNKELVKIGHAVYKSY